MSYTYLFTDTQIEPIINKYINMIDDYDFHSLLNSLIDDAKRDTYIKELKAINDGSNLAISTTKIKLKKKEDNVFFKVDSYQIRNQID